MTAAVSVPHLRLAKAADDLCHLLHGSLAIFAIEEEVRWKVSAAWKNQVSRRVEVSRLLGDCLTKRCPDDSDQAQAALVKSAVVFLAFVE
jgi:hypothetical protein